MKIAIIGYSGSGKSTLARILGEKYGAEVLHLDTVQFLSGWEARPSVEQQKIVKDFLDTHDSWVIDGNYSKNSFDRRMEEADEIIALMFSPISCLYRVSQRYKKYKNTSRPDMANGCNEKLDFEFVKWVLHKGRNKKTRKKFAEIISKYDGKVAVLKNQKQTDAYLKKIL